MSIACELKEQPAQTTLSIRTRASIRDLPQLIGKSYGAIMQYLGVLGEEPVGAPFTAYYNYFNMNMDDLDIEIGFPVARELPGSGEIISSQTPAGKYATYLYTGPYSEMTVTYEAVSKWIVEKGFVSSGLAYEIYLNDPSNVPPQELQTLIMILLQA